MMKLFFYSKSFYDKNYVDLFKMSWLWQKYSRIINKYIIKKLKIFFFFLFFTDKFNIKLKIFGLNMKINKNFKNIHHNDLTPT